MPRLFRQLRIENVLESGHRFPARRPATQRKIFFSHSGRRIQRRARRATAGTETPTTETAAANPEAASKAQTERIRPRSILLPKITKFLRKGRDCRFSRHGRPTVQQNELHIQRLRKHVLRPRLRPRSRKPYRIQMPISLVL